MQHRLGWSTFAAGSVGAANVAGYVLGAGIAARVIAAVAEPLAALGSLSLATFTLAACAATSSLPIFLALRAVNGAAAAVATVAGAVLMVRWARGAPPSSGARMSAVYFAGPAVGIVLSAPLITPVAASDRWRACWLLLALACGICAAIGVYAAYRPAPALTSQETTPRSRSAWRERRIAALLVSYGIFGAGYIAL
jgi:MFS family permease